MQQTSEELAAYARTLAELASTQVPSQHLGGICRKLSQHYRALGILLREADVNRFFHWLIQSALTRRYFPERCQSDENFSSPYRRANLVGPFFDAVAATQNMARKIATLSAKTHLAGEEYEDDFAYAHFLHLLVDFVGPDKAALVAALDQFEEVLDGGSG
ncbi:hypothetical protein AB3N58_17545 (plasmid) [Leptospira sp. WS60.C2]